MRRPAGAGRTADRIWPSAAAGLGAAACYGAAGIIRHEAPWGPRQRGILDLAQQFAPMDVHYRDLLTGQAHGNLFFNWSSGYGVPFIGDFTAYVGTSLSWLTVLFPRDRISLALYVITLLQLALAAGVMTAFLRHLRPTGPVWLAATLGFAYATCGWAIDDAIYMTDWLTGLVAFPLLCLLVERVRRRASATSLVLTSALVGVAWTTHFYTVFMATLGAGVVALTLTLTSDDRPWRTRLAGLGRAALALGLGIGLAAPLLVPTFLEVRSATPSPDLAFNALPPRLFLSRFLMGTEGVGHSGAFAVATVVFVLALTVPLNRRVALRVRVGWTTSVVLTVVSTQIWFTHMVWHGFDTPNGGNYRQAFIICGLLVVAAWVSVSAGVGPVPVAAAALGVGLLALGTWHLHPMTPTTHVVVPASLLLGVAVFAFLRPARSDALPGPGRIGRTLAAALLILGVAAEGVAAAVAIDARRAAAYTGRAVDGPTQVIARGLVVGADQWPERRTTPAAFTTVNDPMLIGGEGSEYYSSTIPDQLTRTLVSMGWGYTAFGRALIDPASPVTDAAFAVGNRLDGRGRRNFLTAHPALPFATIRATTFHSTLPAPFGPQEDALGGSVYTVPDVSVVPQGAARAGLDGSTTRLLATGPEVGGAAEIIVRCLPGNTAWLSAPAFVGDYTVDGRWRQGLGPDAIAPGRYSGLPMRPLGPVGADGALRLAVRWVGQADLPAHPVGCLDLGRLSATIAMMRATAPASLTVGADTVRTVLPSGSTGRLVLATTPVPGWSCAVGKAAGRAPSSYAGLLSVPLDGHSTAVSCQFRPPGWPTGLGVGLLSLLGVLAAALWAWRRVAD
jgi:hypothetical protein